MFIWDKQCHLNALSQFLSWLQSILLGKTLHRVAFFWFGSGLFFSFDLVCGFLFVFGFFLFVSFWKTNSPLILNQKMYSKYSFIGKNLMNFCTDRQWITSEPAKMIFCPPWKIFSYWHAVFSIIHALLWPQNYPIPKGSHCI